MSYIPDPTVIGYGRSAIHANYHTNHVNFMKTYTTFAFALLIATAGFLLSPSVSSAAMITSQLSLNARGADVTSLQTFLATMPAIYPSGLVTGFYGPLTRQAVINFQNANGLDPVGRVGPLTMAKINAMMSGGVTGGADMMAPWISNVQVSSTTTNGSTASTTSLSWTTSENTRSRVYYNNGPISMTEMTVGGPLIGGTQISDSNYLTSHMMTIPMLQPNAMYNYIIEATDASGNVSITWPASFTSLSQ